MKYATSSTARNKLTGLVVKPVRTRVVPALVPSVRMRLHRFTSSWRLNSTIGPNVVPKEATCGLTN